MKKFIFLLVVSVILMLVFNSSYKKNPHLSKINDDVSNSKNEKLKKNLILMIQKLKKKYMVMKKKNY